MKSNYIVVAWIISLLGLYFVADLAQKEIDEQIESERTQTRGTADR